jgi:hypothetical protein
MSVEGLEQKRTPTVVMLHYTTYLRLNSFHNFFYHNHDDVFCVVRVQMEFKKYEKFVDA